MKKEKFVIKQRLGGEIRVAANNNNNNNIINNFNTSTNKQFLMLQNKKPEEIEATKRDLKKLIKITTIKEEKKQQQQQQQQLARLPVIIINSKREIRAKLLSHNKEKDVKFLGRKLRYQTRLVGLEYKDCLRRRRINKMGSEKMGIFASLALFALILHVAVLKQTEAIKLQPEGREKFYWSGEQFVITCQNNNNIKNVKIRWIGPNGSDITEDRSQRVHAESTGPHGHRLVVMNATAATDDGQYKCTLGSTDDRNPREHIEFNLKLFKTTSFKDTPRHLVLPAGQQGTLNCKVEFDPNVLSASVGWVRDQKPIEMFNDSSYTVVEYDSNRQLSQLIISPLTKQLDGVYTCRAVAVTSQLSKISDHDITLETNFAPTFDRTSYTVWVERSQSLVNRQQQLLLQQQQQQQLSQQQQQGGNLYGTHSNISGNQRQNHHQTTRLRHNKQQQQQQQHNQQQQHQLTNNAALMQQPNRRYDSSTDDSSMMNANSTNQIVRVELRCSCQANPPAKIFWTLQNSNLVLAKGQPNHILEEPQTEIDRHNSTSVLILGYNLDVNWPHRGDSYICSASNKLGEATMTFNVEQGDPPPAFNVGPNKQYNPQTSLFQFTLLGPNFDPDSALTAGYNHQQQLAATSAQTTGGYGSTATAVATGNQEIVPPVDSFRIRAENPAGGEQKSSYWSNKRQNELSVQWSLSSSTSSHQQQQNQQHLNQHYQNHDQNNNNNNYNNYNNNRLSLNTPQNFTVNLGKLPSGNQKLFLEAHNAVGWSPNATYLGDYYIVSGAFSSLVLAATNSIYIQIALNALIYLYIGGDFVRFY